jgi:hypothetical protein
MSARAFCVHDALGYPLAIEVREFLEQVMVFEQYRAARPGGTRVLIVGDRGSAIGGQGFLSCHHFLRLVFDRFHNSGVKNDRTTGALSAQKLHLSSKAQLFKSATGCGPVAP